MQNESITCDKISYKLEGGRLYGQVLGIVLGSLILALVIPNAYTRCCQQLDGRGSHGSTSKVGRIINNF